MEGYQAAWSCARLPVTTRSPECLLGYQSPCCCLQRVCISGCLPPQSAGEPRLLFPAPLCAQGRLGCKLPEGRDQVCLFYLGSHTLFNELLLNEWGSSWVTRMPIRAGCPAVLRARINYLLEFSQQLRGQSPYAVCFTDGETEAHGERTIPREERARK